MAFLASVFVVKRERLFFCSKSVIMAIGEPGEYGLMVTSVQAVTSADDFFSSKISDLNCGSIETRCDGVAASAAAMKITIQRNEFIIVCRKLIHHPDFKHLPPAG